ncbi:MAG: hypothetical protein IKY51_05730 [Alistipes sp.]|nr:hypothetical protein [Alistipes sp.]
MVKRIAKYLTLLLAIVVTAIGYANDGENTVAERLPAEASAEFSTTFIDSTTHNSDISLSRQISSPSVLHLQGAAKRTSNAHKNNFEFIAAGKAINVCIENHIFKKSSTINTSFAKSEHKLIRLGKLII